MSAPVRIIESSDNRGLDNRGSTVYFLNLLSLSEVAIRMGRDSSA